MKRLLGDIRRADDAYRLLPTGARVAVGLSGGKDSMALLRLLTAYRNFAGKDFSLAAIAVANGEGVDVGALRTYCDKLETPLTVAYSKLENTLAARKNPCATCARVRRGILIKTAASLGCDTLALGHTRNDAAETLLMNALRQGRIGVFQPKTRTESGVTIIRPLILADEKDIVKFNRREGITPCPLPCPYAGHTERQEMRDLLAKLEGLRAGATEKLTSAIARDLYVSSEGDASCPSNCPPSWRKPFSATRKTDIR